MVVRGRHAVLVVHLAARQFSARQHSSKITTANVWVENHHLLMVRHVLYVVVLMVVTPRASFADFRGMLHLAATNALSVIF